MIPDVQTSRSYANVFGGIALLLALAGVYGVTAQNVTQRTVEIGVRLALGATPSAVLRLVLLRGANLIVVGLPFAMFLRAARCK
jgi:putative ABC transport system permease protein